MEYKMKHVLLILSVFIVSTTVWAQQPTPPPSTYTPQLISFPSSPTGVCDIYQVALNTSNGTYSTCNVSTRTWVATGNNLASPGPIGGTTPAAGTFTTVTANQEILQGISFPSLTITQGGTPGTTQYTYVVLATDALGGTRTISNITLTGNSTLSGSNFNTVTIAAFSGVAPYLLPVGSCNVYRTFGGASTGKIGTIASCSAGGS